MDPGSHRPSAVRWMQPSPMPFWASRLFRWNLVLLSVMLLVVAGYLLVIEPGLTEKARREDAEARASLRYVPRDPASTEPRPVRFDGMLDKVKDDAAPEVRDEPYRHLVKYLAGVDPAKLAAQAKDVDYRILMDKAEEVRGLTVRLNLMFWASPSGPERLEPPVGGVETVTRAYFALPRTPKEIYIVDFVDPLPPIPKETPVIIDAVFLRRVKYERSDRAEFHQAPFLLARNVSKIREPLPPSAYRFRWVVALMGLALLGFLSYLTLKGWYELRSRGPLARRVPG